MAKWRVKEYLILAKTIEANTKEGAIEAFSDAGADTTLLKMTAKKLRRPRP